jgi:hypothetical protein
MSEPGNRACAFVIAAVFIGATRGGAADALEAAGAGKAPHLDLVWVDPTAVAKGSFTRMAAESRAVLAALGAEVEWTAAPNGAVLGPESMAVIALRTFAKGPNRDRHVMGATRRADDGALAVWIFPDQVAWAIGLDIDLRGAWGKGAEERFARALARVASHEVVHALGVPSHASGGLMAACLDRNALLADALDIDGETISTVRRGFQRAALTASGAPVLASLRPAPLTVAPALTVAPYPAP